MMMRFSIRTYTELSHKSIHSNMLRGLRAALFSLLVLGVFPAHAEDIDIAEGTTHTIGQGQDVVITSGTLENRGTLSISEGGILDIGTGVTNSTSEILKGLNLGLVLSQGNILSEQNIHFARGSEVGGAVQAGENGISFHGAATITAALDAKTLTFETTIGDTEDAIKIDMNAGGSLKADTIQINGLVEITGKTDQQIDINSSLILGATGATLDVSENLVIRGDFSSVTGTLIKSDKENWTITFKGGEDQSGWNNILAFSSLSTSVLRLEKNSQLAGNLMVTGKVELGEGSHTQALKGLITGGSLLLEKNAVLELTGDLTGMFAYVEDYYNLVVSNGFTMEEDALITTTDSSGDEAHIQMAFGATSSMAAGSKISTQNLFLTGINPSTGSASLQKIENKGTLEGEQSISLTSVELENAGTGLIKTESLLLLSGTTLTLTNNGSENGGLEMTGKGGMLGIDSSSSIIATGKTIDFAGAAVLNLNTDGGIIASQVYFGDGGSLKGKGTIQAHGTFKKGSTLILDGTGYVNFDSGNVLMQTGSTIQLDIGSGVVGALVTSGQIVTEDGVILSIADGSNFDGRTRQFLIAQGSDESTFSEDLAFAESLFFDLSDHWATELEDEDGNKYLGLVVEVVKVADLIDYAGSNNQRGLSMMIDWMITEGTVSEAQATVYDELMKMSSDAAYRNALDVLSGSVRENALLFAMSEPWRRPLDNIGFHRLSLALERKKPRGACEETTLGQSKGYMPKLPMNRLGLAHDLWLETFYRYDKLDSDHNTTGGEGNRGGFVLGSGLPTISRESLLGISIGYAGGEYKQSGSQVDLDDFQFGLYGGMNLLNRNLQIRGYVGYGIQDYSMDRSIRFGALNTHRNHASMDGTSISAALVLVRPMDMSDTWMLKPSFGIDFERVEQDGFTETGSVGTGWVYDDASFSRTMLRLGFTSDHQFQRIEVSGRFIYGIKVAGDKYASSRHYVPGSPQSNFNVSSVDIGSSVFDFGIGGNYGLNRSRSALLFLDYNATITENSSAHVGSLGILWKR